MSIPLVIPRRYVGYGLNPYHHEVNIQGCRGPQIGEKELGEYRICCLGDSTVYCDNLTYRESWPYNLEKQFHNEGFNFVKVINCGVGGYSTWEILVDFLFRIESFNPDLIILYVGLQDLRSRCARPEEFKADNSGWRISNSMLRPSLWRNHPRIIRVQLKLLSLLKNLMVLNRVSTKNSTFSDKNTQFIKKNGVEFFKNNVESITKLASTRKIGTLILPFLFHSSFPFHLIHEKVCAEGIEQQNSSLKYIALKHDAFFYNIVNDFPKEKNLFSDGRHFSAKGSLLFSELVFEFMRNSHIIE